MKNIFTWGSLALVFLLGAYVVSFNNSMIELQSQIEAKHKDNKQVYGSILTKIKGISGTASEYSDQVVRAIEVAIGSRYGDGGAKGAMLWLKENNPEIKDTLYLKLSQVIESEFTRFEANQTTILDYERVYRNKVKKFPGNILASILGFSMDDIKPFMTVLTTAAANEAFETGTMQELDPFGKSK